MKKKLNKDELYQNMESFLKSKGIEIKDSEFFGSTLKKGCRILTEGINQAQTAIETAKTTMEDQLEKAREVIHRKTAPKGSQKKAEASVSSGDVKKKKSRAKKPSAKKTTAKKNSVKKTSSVNSLAKKSVGDQPPTRKKTASRTRSTNKKATAKKTAVKKSARKKPAGLA